MGVASAGTAVARATVYAEAGATAISVLTEPTRFGGDLSHLAAVANAVEDPSPRIIRRGGTYLASVLALFGGGVRRRRDAEKRTAEDETTISKDANARDRSSAKRRHVPAWMSPPNGPA